MWKFILKCFRPDEEITAPEVIARPEVIQKYVGQLSSGDRIAPHDSYRRFRVLILGPANAGKTTLLERLTESPAGAAIVTRNGQRVILHLFHSAEILI